MDENPLSLDEARASRASVEPTAHVGEVVNILGAPLDDATDLVMDPATAPVELTAEEQSAQLAGGTALTDQMVMFVSVDGLRRIQTVNEPWHKPPLTIELECANRQSAIILPDGNSRPETRGYQYATTIVVREVGLMIHVYQEQ